MRFLASPVAIVKMSDAVGLWALRRDGEPGELAPEPLLSSKFGSRQLDFVDAGLVWCW